MAESHNQHGIARKDSRVIVPFFMHRSPSAAHIRVIHQVIVQQRMVMVSFDTDGSRHSRFEVIFVQAVSHEQQRRAQAFAPHVEHIADRFVKSHRLSGVVNGSKCLIDGVEHRS